MLVRMLAIVVVGDRYAVDAFFAQFRRQHAFVRTDDLAAQVVTGDHGRQCCEKATVYLLEPIEEEEISMVLALAGNVQVAACPCTE